MSGRSERAGAGTDRQRIATPLTAYGIGWQKSATTPTSGRWPSNLIHDGSDEVVGLFPNDGRPAIFSAVAKCVQQGRRFRDEGCEGLPQTIKQSVAHGDKRYGTLPYTNEPREMKPRPRGNHHPTVKPTDLMRYLCRLVTPPGGVVLDPFTGSGSTGKAAILEGFRFIGIERETEYVEIARARIGAV
jgi:adenine-specific DNA-methyltransferase